MAADFYKRKLPGKGEVKAVPVVSTKTAGYGGELKELPVIQPVAHTKHDDACGCGVGASCGCSH